MVFYLYTISASLDDTYARVAANYPTAASAEFGHYYVPASKGNPAVHYYYDAFLRFLIAIPKGSTITNAFVEVIGYNTRIDDFTAQINFTDEGDAADFSANPYSSADGGVDVAWVVPDFFADGAVDTPDISSLIQAYINRGDYNPNQHVAIRIKHGDAGDNEWQKFYQWDGDHAKAAVIIITYTLPPKFKAGLHPSKALAVILSE